MDKTALCDALKSKLDNFRPFPPETLTSLRNYYRVGLTWSSNALEGNSLTESETKVIIEKTTEKGIDIGAAVGVSLAVVLSYVKWKSIGWAIFHGLLNWGYVIYYVIKY